MKPDWKDAPEWAQWLAQDEGGDWYWYGSEPYPTDSGYWLASRVESAAQLHGDWRETREQRPE